MELSFSWLKIDWFCRRVVETVSLVEILTTIKARCFRLAGNASEMRVSSSADRYSPLLQPSSC